MKHLLKKLSIAGGGGSKKPKPPIYKPPVMGELQYGSSYSYAETLDLISDGPVEGIVNAKGRVVILPSELRLVTSFNSWKNFLQYVTPLVLSNSILRVSTVSVSKGVNWFASLLESLVNATAVPSK